MNNISMNLSLLSASVSETEVTTVENAMNKNGFGSVIVAFLYFIGVLLLIYLILMLVSKLGKKKQNRIMKAEKTDEKEETKNNDEI